MQRWIFTEQGHSIYKVVDMLLMIIWLMYLFTFSIVIFKVYFTLKSKTDFNQVPLFWHTRGSFFNWEVRWKSIQTKFRCYHETWQWFHLYAQVDYYRLSRKNYLLQKYRRTLAAGSLLCKLFIAFQDLPINH